MVVAAFDFDGTLIHKDSMLAFVRYVKGDLRYGLGMVWLSPWLLAFKLGWLDRQLAKERLLFHFLGKMSEGELKEKAGKFAEEKLASWLRPQGLERLRWHQQQGHRCLLVTASLDLWTRPWAEKEGLELLATPANFSEGKYQRAFAGKNCYGPEKVRRIRAWLKENKPAQTFAYGDSAGDREMLAWADQSFFKPFSS
jgi:phosphatidylglycerophosphatase C